MATAKHTQSHTPDISIVIPLLDEEKNVEPLYREIAAALAPLGRAYEIIFVDDGSSDGTLDVLRELFKNDPEHIQAVSLLGNQGQTAALHAGFTRARGDIVVAMDGDGQHDPAYLPAFITAIDEGNDLASGWKDEDGQRSALSRALSRMAHRLIGAIVGVKMRYFGATMKAYRRDLLQNLDLSGDLHRFAGALVYYKGIRIREIPITIRARRAGTSHYRFGKMLRVALDLVLLKFLTAYARTPFRIFGTTGMLLSAAGSFGILYVLYEKFARGISALYNTAIVELSAICIIVGIQFIVFGLIAELISRLYYTSHGRELSRVRLHLTQE